MKTMILVFALLFTQSVAASALLERGRTAFEANDIEVAAEAFEQAYKAAPKDAEAAFWLARAELRRGNGKRAEELLEAVVKAKPDHADYQNWYGNALSTNIGSAGTFGQIRMAGKMRGAWQKAVEINPDNLDARASLVQYYLRAPAIAGGGRDKALAEVAEIAKRDKARGHRAMAAVHARDEDWVKASAEYRTAVEAMPENTDLRIELGLYCQRIEDWDCAFTQFRTALAQDADRWMAHYQIGRTALMSAKQMDDGAAALERYLTHTPSGNSPSLAWAHTRLGQLREKQGRANDARAQYQAALNLDPKHEEANKALKALK